MSVVVGANVARWSKNKIREEIKNLDHYNYKYVKTNHRCLVEAATRFFGSWKNAIEDVGIKYDDVCQKNMQRQSNKKWDAKSIANEIIILNNAKSRPTKYFRSVAVRHFGCWHDAVKYAGLKPDIFDDKYTKEKIIYSILNITPHDDLKNKNAIKKYTKLYYAALHHYGSWAQAVESSGINYDKIKYKMDKEEIINKIKCLKIKNDYYASRFHKRLYRSAIYLFGSWRAAIISSGIDYSDIKDKQFSEKVVLCILRDIFGDISIIRHKRFSWLINKETGKNLEIDFYIPCLKLAIEYQGRQHFRPVCFGGCSLEKAEENLVKQKCRDKIKKNLLRRNGIKLIEIHYTEYDILGYIKKESAKRGLPVDQTHKSLHKISQKVYNN